jgi:hypothetical protein
VHGADAAVIRTGDGAQVWIGRPEGTRASGRVGPARGDQIEIRSGLAAARRVC